MIKVIGVRFRKAGKIYYFDPAGYEIEAGEDVIVETARGVEFGYVVKGMMEITEEEVVQPLKKVIRIATDKDLDQEEENSLKEADAYLICTEKIKKHKLVMKLIDCEYTFDKNKLLFYFTADGRIDFRELVKDLAAVFKTRIELRQIGVRDETKMIGSIGICGRPLCCYSHLSEFHPVSIKMAKEQNLSLNPTKISGVCGRLMCCLKYEEETYIELNKKMPHYGDTVIIPSGKEAEVKHVNILRQLVKVLVRDGDNIDIIEYHLDELQIKRKKNAGKARLPKEEYLELKKLEKLEKKEKELNAKNK